MAAALNAAAVESADKEGATSSPWDTKALRKGAGRAPARGDGDIVGTGSSASLSFRCELLLFVFWLATLSMG